MAQYPQSDNRRVALIKSLATNNRFYALIDPDTGIRNADTVEHIPDDLLLGIAYPCLEDGLNDFAVIRTTFETLDLFPEDDPIYEEMREIINDARSNLIRRLGELRDKVQVQRAHFLGTDYREFKSYALDMVYKGFSRRNLDSMMKLNVFTSVAEAEGHSSTFDMLYNYEFCPHSDLARIAALSAHQFLVALLGDVLHSVEDDANYKSKYHFDRNVFQKFIAVMFVNYATTNPMFYGINRRDYGVSVERDMDNTPLYLAIGRELREIERRLREGETLETPIGEKEDDELDLATLAPLAEAEAPAPAVILPNELINEEVLLAPITSLCSAAAALLRKNDSETQHLARMILADASRLVKELKHLGVVSPFANDPGDCAP